MPPGMTASVPISAWLLKFPRYGREGLRAGERQRRHVRKIERGFQLSIHQMGWNSLNISAQFYTCAVHVIGKTAYPPGLHRKG